MNTHTKFHFANGKREILVVDDEMINREILGMILQNDYEVHFAVDGEDALRQIHERCGTLSLILLDLMMPGISGIEVLRRVREDPMTKRIPVIVLTADQEAEVKCIRMGAIDFIPKPYPQADVILARIVRTIELSEDRDIIRSTERDPVTDLYNREFFFQYCQQYDQFHNDLPMDAILININHFRTINERFGTAFGDKVLKSIGDRIREAVKESGGIVCRRESDTFLVYCPHREDYKEILNYASVTLSGDESQTNRIRLRMGVYPNVDKSVNVERRFDRAKSASDAEQSHYGKSIGVYDDSLHQKELYQEQLLDDFRTAIHEEQFTVFYQPKFNIRGETPVLSSAEALVRWVHPVHGFISPGIFIPLFEENGMIEILDRYVWEHAAAQQRQWKETLGFTLPVSVNVSRVDMYDPDLHNILQGLVDQNGLTTADILLEITESACTDSTTQIQKTTERLRNMGFKIEMDDFGAGYSSLSMIDSLPIDVLKLDMSFVRNATEQQNTKLLEVMMELAAYLGVPTIAEGVETQEQLMMLKEIGCDIIQGYYFSKPVPAEEYEVFLKEYALQTV